jgi:hypothetical protein
MPGIALDSLLLVEQLAWPGGNERGLRHGETSARRAQHAQPSASGIRRDRDRTHRRK